MPSEPAVPACCPLSPVPQLQTLARSSEVANLADPGCQDRIQGQGVRAQRCPLHLVTAPLGGLSFPGHPRSSQALTADRRPRAGKPGPAGPLGGGRSSFPVPLGASLGAFAGSQSSPGRDTSRGTFLTWTASGMQVFPFLL